MEDNNFVIYGVYKKGNKVAGISSNLKYFKMEFIEKNGMFYDEYSYKLLRHVKELVELENGINFDDNKEISIVLTDDELDKFVNNIDDNCKVIYLGHDVLPTEEHNKIFKDRKITINIIPDYYYKEMDD